VARQSGAALQLVHVYVPNVSHEQRLLSDAVSAVAAHAPEIRVTATRLEAAQADCVADVLAAHVSRSGADLIVLNSHARGGLSRWWMGSVADDLVHRTSVPLLVTPDLEDEPTWQPAPMLRHILIGLDGTPLAEQILPAALTLGRCMKAEYTLLRVVEPAPVPVVDVVVAPIPVYDTSLVERQQAAAETYLTRMAAQVCGDDARAKVHAHVLLDANPADGICGYLRQHDQRVDCEQPIDLIALATHGRDGLARLLLGSVADRVLQHTPIPLLLQRPSSAGK
jgi:nucleotide-binding universal stress UspA family protein